MRVSSWLVAAFGRRPDQYLGGRRLLQLVAPVQGDDTAGEILELPGNRQLKLFLE